MQIQKKHFIAAEGNIILKTYAKQRKGALAKRISGYILTRITPQTTASKIDIKWNEKKQQHWTHCRAVVLHWKVFLLFCPPSVLSHAALKLVSRLIEISRFRAPWPWMIFLVSWWISVRTSRCVEGRRSGIRYAVLETLEGTLNLTC